MSLIINALTSNAAADFVQNSTAQVLSEGCLKAVGRPTFTLLDKSASEEERKYSATKEFLYQSLSMSAYFLIISPFKQISYKFLKYFKPIKDLDVVKAQTKEEFDELFKNMPEGIDKTRVRGANEVISILASGVILAMITPQIVNRIIHPIMKKLGIEQKENNKFDKNV